MIPGNGNANRSGSTSRGGAVLNAIVFIAGTALILAGVVAGERCGFFDRLFCPSKVAAPDNAPKLPDAVVEWTSAPAPDNHPDAPPVPTPVPPPRAEPKFIGDPQYKLYHRPDCKVVKTIPEEKRVAFGSAREAFDAGYIPCKICAPETPAAIEEPEAVPARPVSSQLVGDAAKHRYHRADCKYAKAIAPENHVPLKSSADAFDRGYFPCRTCDPDVPVLMANLPPPRPANVAPVAPANLTEPQKRAMYVSLHALKGMLKGIGRSERPYEVLSDRYGIPPTAVHAVEAEGDSRQWPRQ